jgi:hypothetical protein
MERRTILVDQAPHDFPKATIRHMKARLLIVFVAASCMAACSAQVDKSVQEKNQRQQSNQVPIADQQTRIAPGRCRIVGTIVSIDSTLDEKGPCSRAPCRAIVRVDSILGYGSSFGNPIALSKQISVRFAFTIAPTTSDLFPNAMEQLPGLQVGARFQTDIESQNEVGMSGRHSSYLIQDYKKLN